MNILEFDMCRRMRERFADWQKEVDVKAEEARKTAEARGYMAAYAQRHPTDPEAAT